MPRGVGVRVSLSALLLFPRKRVFCSIESSDEKFTPMAIGESPYPHLFFPAQAGFFVSENYRTPMAIGEFPFPHKRLTRESGFYVSENFGTPLLVRESL